jgi:hypothetical protein
MTMFPFFSCANFSPVALLAPHQVRELGALFDAVGQQLVVETERVVFCEIGV